MFLVELQRRGRSNNTYTHYVQIIMKLCAFAARKGYVTRSPLSGESEIIRRKKGLSRTRRLMDDEEARLLAAAPWRLQRLIIGALETGCRLGELLALQWAHVEGDYICIRAEHAKDDETRFIPISTRLAAVLEMARAGIDGQPHPLEAFVFGDRAGRQTKGIATTWETTVLKAHGVAVTRDPKTHALSPEARAAYRAMNLRFHDLRHEAGSRLIERGWPVHHVRDLLGHASLETTNRYLNVTKTMLRDSMRRSDDAICKKLQDPVVVAAAQGHQQAPRAASNSLVN
jgi:integrase